MKYRYNFRGETSWDTAYQIEGPPVRKKAKVVIFLWGGGKDHSKPFGVTKSDMFSGKGMVSFPPLFLPQIFVGSPMYLETEGWKGRMDHAGPLEY